MNVRMLTALIVAACVAPATCAEIIHFVNPAPGQGGHYDWRWEFAGGWESWLDITQTASAQMNARGGSSVGQQRETFGPIGYSANFTSGGAAVAIDFSEFGDAHTRAMSLGDPLEEAMFRNESLHAAFIINHEPLGVYSLIPEGERKYLGVLTAEGRYGWIELERTGMSLTAFSWAYETEPGATILAGQVPAPGTGVGIVLAVAAAGAQRRRQS